MRVFLRVFLAACLLCAVPAYASAQCPNVASGFQQGYSYSANNTAFLAPFADPFLVPPAYAGYPSQLFLGRSYSQGYGGFSGQFLPSRSFVPGFVVREFAPRVPHLPPIPRGFARRH